MMGCVLCCYYITQMTAYEVRISDVSSDVCSADLDPRRQGPHPRQGGLRPQAQAGGNEDGREIRAGEKSRETGGEEGNAEKANGHDREEDLETGGEEVL